MPQAPKRHKRPNPFKQHKQPQPEGGRANARGRGYTARWDRFRKTFLKANPLCEYCRVDGKATAAQVVDHDVPHRLDPQRFWATSFTALCAIHHNGEKARMEARLNDRDLLEWVKRRKAP